MRRFALAATAIALSLFTPSLFARDLPPIDAFLEQKPGNAVRQVTTNAETDLVDPRRPMQVEPRLGVPTMLWASKKRPAPAPAGPKGPGTSSAELNARAFLAQYSAHYRMRSSDARDAALVLTHDTGTGPVIAKFKQRVEGVEIFREEVNVLMDRKLELIAIGGYISSTITPPAHAGQMSFTLDARNAAVNAYQNLTVEPLDASQLVPAGTRGEYEYYDLPASANPVEPLRVKKVYFHLAEGLEPGYYVEVAVRDEVPSVDGDLHTIDYYAYVISAVDGRVLFRHNLTADAGGTFTYRVWADMNGVPYDAPSGNAVHPKITSIPDGYQAPMVAPNDVTIRNFPFSKNDPWLDETATETVGNNVDAYADVVSGDGYTNASNVPPADPASADFRAQLTGPGQFLHTHTPNAPVNTAEQRQGAIQQLFFDNNFLHDWFYDSGFDEVSRNAQQSNYGRGGLEGDRIRAEAQDYGGRNNANMATPADGASPRMQMYVFDSQAPKFVDVLSPANIAARRAIGTGTFGPQSFDLTLDVAQPNPATGCTAASFTGLSGKIAMVDFSGAVACSIGTKLVHAQNAGAAGFILVYVSTSPNNVVNVTGSLPSFTIPFTSISWNSAAPIKTELAVPNTVTARLYRELGTERDGTIDNQIVFHEWGHYLSNRLIGNGSGLNTTQAQGLGEGWGDFLAMLLTVRENDTATPSNATWNGTYALATYTSSGGTDGNSNNGYYFGIRRLPYSTDMTRNPLTYKHIANGEAIAGAPILYGADGANNAEVHATGEVWAQMLWECYAALLRDTQGANPRLTFTEAQTRMKRYLVASMKMTPSVAPTFVEARDAVLAAAYATDLVDYTRFWQAFAKRGLGAGATATNRDTFDNTGGTESFEPLPELVYDRSTLDDGAGSCDGDGVLDAGESGTLTIHLTNTGSTRLSGITGTIASNTSGFTIDGDGTVTFPDVDPLGTTATTVTVHADAGVIGITAASFTFQYTQPDIAGTPRTQSLGFRTNTSTIVSASATDTVESTRLLWTPSFNPVPHGLSFGTFRRVEISPLQHAWHAPDVSAPSDERLTSPVFTVDGSGSVNIQFDHSWVFESDATANYDGGVIEMSVNGGAFTSIGGPAYNGVLTNYAGNTNPLRGQQAFVKSSNGTVHTSLTQAVAPGSIVQFRFRAASDGVVGADGWTIDNIALSGVVETPFDVVVSDPGCNGTQTATTTTLTPSANPSPIGAPLTLTATVVPDPGTGLVEFYDDTTLLGSAMVVNGQATIAAPAFAMGAHNLIARFTGFANYDASSGSTLVTISKATTSVALVPSSNPIVIGDSVTFTATVTGSNGTPEGSVTFLDGTTTLATIALTAGGASYSTSALAIAAHPITARFEGNASTLASTSAVTTLDVAPLTPAISAGGPTTFCSGASVTLTSSSATGNQWLLDGSPIDGATNQTYDATATGAYTVVVTQNAVSSTASNPVDVTVNPTPAIPSITPGGATTFCAGGSVTLTSSSATGNQWFLDGNPIGGATSQIFSATTSGAYTVVVTSEFSCASLPSAAVNVIVNPTPGTPAVTPGGPTTFCTGGSVTLTSSSATGNQWYLDGNPIDAATNQVFSATASGAYTVVVTSTGCASAPSTAVNVTVNPTPAKPTITPGGATTFCAGGSVTLTSSSATGNQWFLDGNPIGGATSQSVVATTSGAYTVVVTSEFSCASVPSLPVDVTVNPIPATPTITGGPTTFCTGGSVTLTSSNSTGNQWYLNGNPIGGATQQTYDAAIAGDYTVVVTAIGCASAPSAAAVVTINPNPDATITSVGSVEAGSTGHTASVANAGAGATYAWNIVNGTITAGAGTNSITFTAGAVGQTDLSVAVTTSGGCTDSDTASVTVTPLPPAVTVTSVAPNSGSSLGGTIVTITGSGFDPGASVLFGGTAATGVVVLDDAHITAVAPAHAAGAVNVTVTNTDTTTGTLSNGFTYTLPAFDANGDSVIDPSDIVYLVAYLFTGGPAPAGAAGMASGDANGDGHVDPADIFYAVNFLYGDGPNPFVRTPRVDASNTQPFSGAVTLGEPVLRGDRWRVPVIVTMDEHSTLPRAVSLRVRFGENGSNAVIRRGNVAQPVFEISRPAADSISYLVVFHEDAPLVLDASRSAVIAEIELTANGATRLAVDPTLTMLMDGGRKATTADRSLRIGAVSIGKREPHQQQKVEVR